MTSKNDVEKYIEIRNELLPERSITYDEYEKHDSIWPDDKFKQVQIININGKDSGVMRIKEAYWQTDPGHFEVDWLVPSIELEEGLFQLSEIEKSAKVAGATTIEMWMPDYAYWQIESLKSAKFLETQRNPESELDLQHFNESQFEDDVAKVDYSRYRILNLVDLSKVFPDDWMMRYWQAEWDLFQDVPVPWEKKQTPFEGYQKQLLIEKESWPTMLVVLDGEEIVATTMLFRSEAVPEQFYTGLTAVKREHRRQGLATAIKVQNLQNAKSLGGIRVMADNEKDNPMLDLNLSLGFGVKRVWSGFQKKIS